jgi:hypothetical protein
MTNVVVDLDDYMEALRVRDSEIKRLREALREVARCDFQAWARNALEKDADAQKQTLERIAQYDMQKITIDALGEGKE